MIILMTGKQKNCIGFLTVFMLITSVLLSGLSLAKEDSFVFLFDGKSLNGWIATSKTGQGYVAKNGILICPATGGGNLFSVKEYSDFILRFEFRLQEGSNNGVGIRSPLNSQDAAYVGMEIQILDNQSPRYKDKLRSTQYHGSIYDVAPAKRGFLKPVGDWNKEEITAVGKQITVKLNGTAIVNFNLDSVTDPKTLQKHPGLSRKNGHIGFLGHGTKVEFRNIRIKEIF